jgi:hypothetical protein
MCNCPWEAHDVHRFEVCFFYTGNTRIIVVTTGTGTKDFLEEDLSL